MLQGDYGQLRIEFLVDFCPVVAGGFANIRDIARIEFPQSIFQISVIGTEHILDTS